MNMKQVRKIIEIDENLCDGCGNCVPSCAEGAIQIVDGKARVVADKYCDGLGACLGECPQGALKIVERLAEEFDEQAVNEMLGNMEKEKINVSPVGGGCPSGALSQFPVEPRVSGQLKTSGYQGSSALTHWPVQIRLIPPGAFFLEDADLLIAADCVPVAYPSFHRDFLQGKAVMIGCPKFDNAQEYINKLSNVFERSRINSITCVVMEVPCCSGLPRIIVKALEQSGKDIPLEQKVISTRGTIISGTDKKILDQYPKIGSFR